MAGKACFDRARRVVRTERAVSTPPKGSDAPQASDAELLARAAGASRALHDAVAARVVGQEGVIELMLVALLARGHARNAFDRVKRISIHLAILGKKERLKFARLRRIRRVAENALDLEHLEIERPVAIRRNVQF